MQVESQIPQVNLPSSLRLTAAAGVAALAAGSAFVAYFDPSKANFLPVCPLFALTGLACPGCGLTRSFHALFHGDIITAVDFNMLTPFWALIFAYTAVALTMMAVRGKGLPMWPTNPRFITIFGVVLLTFGVLRNIPAYPFTILFP
ncbi:MAG: DUF2752 domain-containing protein [Acidobacteria bacterium]|nr:DUF2752 domain-containing protein [Acidobacteriota bacterium]MBK7932211.1 DUF2752 domain-containing protein [Acidobacteriota bacterium]